VIFVDIKDVLNDGPVYPSKVFSRPGEDVIVDPQEVDELTLGFVIQHSGDDDLLAGVTFQ